MNAPGPSPDHPLRGVLLIGGAVFLLACMDTTTKFLVKHYQVPLVMTVRYLVHTLLMLVLLTPTHGRQLFETRRTGLVLVRAVCLAAASLFVGLALRRMPVAEATAILPECSAIRRRGSFRVKNARAANSRPGTPATRKAARQP